MADLQQDIVAVFRDKNFWVAFAFVVFNPFYWTFFSRLEYHTKCISKMFCGDKYAAVNVFGMTVVALAGVRAIAFHLAEERGKKLDALENPFVSVAGAVMLVVGFGLAVVSCWQLGWYGSWQGDHFGILMDAPVTAFPFSVLPHPWYFGQILQSFGAALYAASLSGLLLAVCVMVVYLVTMSVEGPFTTMIYAEKATRERALQQKQPQPTSGKASVGRLRRKDIRT